MTDPWPLWRNSLLLSGLTTALALPLGALAALGLSVLEARWRKGVLFLAVLAFMLPPFLVTNSWLDLLDVLGQNRAGAALNLFSMPGAIWILALLSWPIPFLLVFTALGRLDRTQLEQEPAMHGWGLIRWLLWPLAQPAARLGAVLVFVLAWNHFSVPALLQVNVTPALVWTRFNTTFDYGEALRVGWVAVLGPLVFFLMWRRAGTVWPSLEGPAGSARLRAQLGRRWCIAAVGALGLLLLLSVVVPLGQLAAHSRTWSELGNVWPTGGRAAWQSVRLSGATAGICLGLGLLAWRWRGGMLFWLPFLLPGVLLGMGLIVAVNRPGLQWFYQSSAVVITGWTLRYLAPCWQWISHARHGVDADLRDAARLSGASGWRMFWQVDWPQIRGQAAWGAYLVYLFCLWDVETLILIVPPGGETLALRIFNLLHYGHHAQVNALCVYLLGLAAAPLAGWIAARWITRRCCTPSTP